MLSMSHTVQQEENTEGWYEQVGMKEPCQGMVVGEEQGGGGGMAGYKGQCVRHV